MPYWRGLKSLVHDAVDATTLLVGEGHDSASRSVRRVASHAGPAHGPVHAVDTLRAAITSGVLASIRGVNRGVEAVTDVGLDALQPLAAEEGRRAATTPIPMRSDLIRDPRLLGDAALGFLNGAIGDHLAARDNTLDLGLQLRHGDRYLDDASTIVGATRRLVVLVHGLSTTEWSWCLDAHNVWGDPRAHFGSLLERDLGFTPVFVRYNSGRRVAENGRRLSEALERLVGTWPGELDEIVLLGHSMGGLVSRSAVDSARRDDARWRHKLSRVIAVGSPHQGAPFARFGEHAASALRAIDLPATRVVSRLIAGRSVGIRDLEHGTVSDDGAELPLAEGVAWHFIAGTMAPDAAHPLGAWLGDLLVPVSSAHGPRDVSTSAPVDTTHFGGVLHHRLQNHRDVYDQVRRACEGDAPTRRIGG